MLFKNILAFLWPIFIGLSFVHYLSKLFKIKLYKYSDSRIKNVLVITGLQDHYKKSLHNVLSSSKIYHAKNVKIQTNFFSISAQGWIFFFCKFLKFLFFQKNKLWFYFFLSFWQKKRICRFVIEERQNKIKSISWVL